MVTTVLVSVFAMHFVVMEVALPLWVAGHTEAPRWIVAVVFGVNTVAVALLQVRFSRSSATVPAGAASLVRAGALLALGFAAIAVAGAVGPGGVLVHTHDIGDWAAAIDGLLHTPDERKRLSGNAVRHAARFGWDATTDRLLTAYGDACRTRTPSPISDSALLLGVPALVIP